MNDEETFAKDLLAAGRAEEPRRGAKARALAAVVPQLEVATAVDAGGGSRRVPLVAVMIGYLLVAAALVAGIGLKRQDDLRANDAVLASEISAQRARYDELTIELEAQTDHLETLRATLDEAKTVAAAGTRVEEATRLRADQGRDATVRGGAAFSVQRPAKAKNAAACACSPGDPLCSCMP